MTEITGGYAVARLLREYEVEFVFGQPGGQTLPIYDGLYDLAPQIQHILVHDEKAGVFMADAYARISFKPGICDATVGPATTNLVTGVAEAYGNSIPLIVITSDVLSTLAGKGVSQECDQIAVLKPFTKASFRVDRTEKIPETVRKAFRIAVTDSYERGCAVTGEHSLPALEAAHIKPYHKEGPHEVANGLLLRADLHRLLDKGYVTISTDLKLIVSRRLQTDFSNGRTYYPLDGRPVRPPRTARDQVNREYLKWHNNYVYLG